MYRKINETVYEGFEAFYKSNLTNDCLIIQNFEPINEIFIVFFITFIIHGIIDSIIIKKLKKQIKELENK